MQDTVLKIGAWTVSPTLNSLESGVATVRIQPRAMDLLVYLARRPGEVVSIAELLESVWGGRYVVDHAVYRVIGQLREALGDSTDHPSYIETVPRRGYRLIARVERASAPGVGASAPGAGQTKADSLTTKRRLSRVRVASAAALSIAVLAWILFSVPEPEPAGSDPPISIILVQGTRPADPQLYGLFENELSSVIADSQEFSFLPEDQVAEILRRMRLSPEAPFSQRVALEIAARASTPALVLVADLFAPDDRVVFRGSLHEPHSSAPVAEDGFGPSRRSDVSGEMNRAARRMLEQAAQSAESYNDQPDPLELVTTDSLAALELYSDVVAISKTDGTGQQRISELTRAALAIDPDFASARILNAWWLRNSGGNSDDFLAEAEQALALVDHVTPNEALFIRGSYEMLTGNFARAAELFQELVDIDAGHFWGVNNLAFCYEALGASDLAARYFVMRSDLVESRPDLAAQAAERLSKVGSSAEAARYLERARSAAAARNAALATEARIAMSEAAMETASILSYWLDGDFVGMRDELERLEQSLEAMPGDKRTRVAGNVVHAYLVLGQTMRAVAVAERFLDRPVAEWVFALVGLGGDQEFSAEPARDDKPSTDELVRRFAQAVVSGRIDDPFLRSDLLNELRSERLAAEQELAEGGNAFLRAQASQIALLEGVLHRLDGDDEQAAMLFRQTLSNIEARGSTTAAFGFISARALASILEEAGDDSGAIAILERWGGSQSRRELKPDLSAILWVQNRFALSRLLEESDPERAAELSSELSRILASADTSHELARALL